MGGFEVAERSVGVSNDMPSEPGVGDGRSMWAEKGILCGNGDMSIMSTQPGDDAGRGGVVMKPVDASRQSQQAMGSSSPSGCPAYHDHPVHPS